MAALNSLLFLVLALNIFLRNSVNPAGVERMKSNLDESCETTDPGEPLFLTPYIESGDIETARSLSRVGKLPNSPDDYPSYSGLFTVNKEYDSNMFFWFFPALNNDTKAPVVLWLEGGPGASDLLSLFVINGPYVVLKDLTVESRPTTWAREFNLLYVDNPVGSGFSFTTSDDGYSKDEDDAAVNLYEFLQQFFKVFYEYATNDFYIIGESFAGKYVPAIGYKIHTDGAPAQTQFKGIGIGNGICEMETQMNYSDYYYQLGIVDRNQAEVIRIASEKAVENIRNGNYLEAVEYFNRIVKDDPTEDDPDYLLEFAGFYSPYNLLITQLPEDILYFFRYVQLPEFRKAVHVGNLTFNDGAKAGSYFVPNALRSIRPRLVPLMDNYKVMMYNGQLDLILPYPQMGDFLDSIAWRLSDEYKNATQMIWRLNQTNEVAGYVHNVGDFYRVLVRNAGHIVPHDKPEYALDMITRFIKGEPFA